MLKNPILAETVAHIESVRNSDLDSLVVERAVFGLFFSGVKLSDGSGGLCFTPVKEMPQAVCCPSSAQAMPLSGKLAGRPVRKFLEDLDSPNILKKTLAIAVLNALSSSLITGAKDRDYEYLPGRDAFDEAVLPAGKTVVVGALAPMLRRLLKAGADFTVLEMDPATLKPAEMPFYAPADQAAHYLPQADLLVITGVTILNDTLPDLLKLAKPGASVIVAGPTVGMLPQAFFKRGVGVLGGIMVTRPDELLDVIAEGGSGYHFFGQSAERLVIKPRADRRS